MIKLKDFPDFWIFMYWLNPLHYILEGLIVTQFHRDGTQINITGTTDIVTANTYVADFYSDWHYSARGYDILALGLFIIALRYVVHHMHHASGNNCKSYHFYVQSRHLSGPEACAS